MRHITLTDEQYADMRAALEEAMEDSGIVERDRGCGEENTQIPRCLQLLTLIERDDLGATIRIEVDPSLPPNTIAHKGADGTITTLRVGDR